MKEKQDRLLIDSPRVLDLTDEKGLLCGKILGDMGADVIKIEKPGGDRARRIGPFYHDIPHPDKSLYWFAFNNDKRSITLDIETGDGRDIFKKLARRADFVIESFDPGYMDKIGLGYSTLSKLNPQLIMTSITPFGQTGPYRDFKGSDIVVTAMAGWLYLCGDPDRPPLRISVPQAYVNASAEAAASSIIAYYYRESSGEGQHVDVSAQHSLIADAFNSPVWYEFAQVILQRAGPFKVGTTSLVKVRQIWACKDGFVSFSLFGGAMGSRINHALVEWMNTDRMVNDFLNSIDWEAFDMATVTQELVDRIEGSFAGFFTSHTKAELYEGAVQRHIMLYPVCGIRDIVESPQLEARDFWVSVEHTELDTSLTYPGEFFKASETSCRIQRRAPLAGEHNSEIYERELGLSEEALVTLQETRII